MGSATGVVKEAWNTDVVGLPMFQVTQKITHTRLALDKWQKQAFKASQHQMLGIRSRLEELLDVPLSDNVQNEKRHLMEFLQFIGGDFFGSIDPRICNCRNCYNLKNDGMVDDRARQKSKLLYFILKYHIISYLNFSFLFLEIKRLGQIDEKLQNEVMGIADGKQDITESELDKMPYLKAVIIETLSTYPPMPLLGTRESTQDAKIKGYDIAAKTMVIINAWEIGRDPSLWDEPEKFQPDRFMNSSTDFRGQDVQFIPFEAGRRGCPGILFSMITTELVLVNLVHKFEWALHSGARARDMNMTECNSLVIHRDVPLLAMAAPWYSSMYFLFFYVFMLLSLQQISPIAPLLLSRSEF
ncbi:cytochrome P450 736A117-like [Rosa rugosa]|uniref:cytochrome P450 736A117-like n=1 Tax=Rosa rugosa TaxID=74645 RepID=UPI002B414566|nr:cytochrome P450 736A117-like [Rosa rugosa]